MTSLKWALSHQGFARTCCRLLKWLNAPYAPYVPRLGLSTPSRFDHLIHYGGSYYCYLFNRVLASPRFDSALRNVLDRNWVEALAAHVWRQSFEADPFNPEVGVRLRGLVLQISNDNTYSILQHLIISRFGYTLDHSCYRTAAARPGLISNRVEQIGRVWKLCVSVFFSNAISLFHPFPSFP